MHEKGLIDEQTYHQARADEFVWRQARALGVSRRRFLGLLAGAAGAATLGGVGHQRAFAAPAGDLVVKPTPPEYFNDFGSNKEMRWEVMYSRGYVVPNELFFVRDHSRTA